MVISSTWRHEVSVLVRCCSSHSSVCWLPERLQCSWSSGNWRWNRDAPSSSLLVLRRLRPSAECKNSSLWCFSVINSRATATCIQRRPHSAGLLIGYWGGKFIFFKQSNSPKNKKISCEVITIMTTKSSKHHLHSSETKTKCFKSTCSVGPYPTENIHSCCSLSSLLLLQFTQILSKMYATLLIQFLQTFASFWSIYFILFYFILFYMCERNNIGMWQTNRHTHRQTRQRHIPC